MTSDQLNLLGAAFAFLAAVLWIVSAAVQVTHQDKTDADGWTEAAITSDGKNVIESGKLQQKWSRRAAYAAAAAAVMQGIALLVGPSAI